MLPISRGYRALALAAGPDPYRGELHRLTDLLGHNQDLDVLRITLLAEPDVVASHSDRTVLLGLVEQREREVRRQAWHE